MPEALGLEQSWQEGKELYSFGNYLWSFCHRTKALAAEYMYVCVTGEYSAKIFLKLGYTLDSEFLYENFRDRNGEEILADTREHKKMRVLYTKL